MPADYISPLLKLYSDYSHLLLWWMPAADCSRLQQHCSRSADIITADVIHLICCTCCNTTTLPRGKKIQKKEQHSLEYTYLAELSECTHLKVVRCWLGLKVYAPRNFPQDDQESVLKYSQSQELSKSAARSYHLNDIFSILTFVYIYSFSGFKYFSSRWFVY